MYREVAGMVDCYTDKAKKLLKEFRLKSKLSLADVASKVGVTKGYIHQIESGHRPVPKHRFLIQLLRVYEVTPKYFEELLSDTQDETKRARGKARADKTQMYHEDFNDDGLPDDELSIQDNDLSEYLVSRYGHRVLFDIRAMMIQYFKFSSVYLSSRHEGGFYRNTSGKAEPFKNLSALKKRSAKPDITFKDQDRSRLNSQLLVFFMTRLLSTRDRKNWKDVALVLSYYYKKKIKVEDQETEFKILKQHFMEKDFKVTDYGNGHYSHLKDMVLAVQKACKMKGVENISSYKMLYGKLKS